MIDSDEDDGFEEERQRGFETGNPLDAYTSLFGLVLISYGYHCALTGAKFGPPVLHLHPDLDVVVLRPLEHGGALAISNCLPMLTSLRRPFMEGLVTVKDDYRIVTPHPQLLPDEILDALRASLFVPKDSALQPSGDNLAYHRRYALSR